MVVRYHIFIRVIRLCRSYLLIFRFPINLFTFVFSLFDFAVTLVFLRYLLKVDSAKSPTGIIIHSTSFGLTQLKPAVRILAKHYVVSSVYACICICVKHHIKTHKYELVIFLLFHCHLIKMGFCITNLLIRY